MKFTSIIALILIAQAVFGQTETAKTANAKADKAYEQLGYKEAIDLYRAGQLDLATMERIANGYRLNGDTWNAERWYSQIVPHAENPIICLYYAQAMHSNGKLAEAKEYYLRYNLKTGGSDKRGERLAQAIDRQGAMQAGQAVSVVHEVAINSPKLDFSPAFYENGVVFVSNRDADEALVTHKDKDAWTGDDFVTLYFSAINEQGKLGKPALFETNLASRYHEGPLCFSKGSDQLYFTRNDAKSKAQGNGEVKLKIYASEKRGNSWSEASLVDLGEKLANDAHPSLSPDGQRLYFASDRLGGLGGMDIYMAAFVDGKWQTPKNLGPKVNTSGNELFPYVHDDGTLYFASDGWQSVGGLDIFYTEKKNDGTYAEPVNLGEPFNSPKDDFGYIIDVLGTKGYFTSSRDGGFGKDDIYSFELPSTQSNKKRAASQVELTICVTDATTEERIPAAKVTVMEQQQAGIFEGVDEDFVVKLVPNARGDEYMLSLKKRDPFAGQPLSNQTYTTDADGNIAALLNPEKKYMLLVRAEGYKETQYVLSGDQLKTALIVGNHCVPIGRNDCLAMTGRVVNKRDKTKLPGATVTLMNLCTGDLATVLADGEGRYEFPCLPCDCDFVVQGSKANFRQDNNLASTAGMDCTSANGPISKDLELVPILEPDGRPNVVTYHPDDTEKPIYPEPKTKRTGPASQPDWREPTPGYLNDPELLNRILEDGLTIELENIYYDFDKYAIRPDAAFELDKVVELMQRNPDLMVQLRSHTDCRANNAYNQTLSENRAKAAVDYIVQHGISRYRITSKGYGESWPNNECTDGVDCPEPDHQMNRRTEIKIFKK